MHPLLEKLVDEINKLPPQERDVVLERLLKTLPAGDSDKKSSSPIDITWRI